MEAQRAPSLLRQGRGGPTFFVLLWLLLSYMVDSESPPRMFFLVPCRAAAPAEQSGAGSGGAGGGARPESASQGEEGGREGEEAVALPEGGQAAVLQRRRGDADDRHGGQDGGGEGKSCRTGALAHFSVTSPIQTRTNYVARYWGAALRMSDACCTRSRGHICCCFFLSRLKTEYHPQCGNVVLTHPYQPETSIDQPSTHSVRVDNLSCRTSLLAALWREASSVSFWGTHRVQYLCPAILSSFTRNSTWDVVGLPAYAPRLGEYITEGREQEAEKESKLCLSRVRQEWRTTWFTMNKGIC